MAKFRKKPVEVEAFRLVDQEVIETLEGTMTGNPGDSFILAVFLMPLIIGIMVWTQLGQGLRVLVAEYRDFNPGSSTWK
jgi:hypothetical protein